MFPFSEMDSCRLKFMWLCDMHWVEFHLTDRLGEHESSGKYRSSSETDSSQSSRCEGLEDFSGL